MSAPDELLVIVRGVRVDAFETLEAAEYEAEHYDPRPEIHRYVRAPTAPQGAEPLICLEQMNADNLAGYDFGCDESMTAFERVLDEVEQGKPLTGVSQPRWQKIRERIHALAAPQGAEIARGALRELIAWIGERQMYVPTSILFRVRAALTPTDAETKG